MAFEDLFSTLIPQIQNINEKYNEQKSILDSLNTATTELLMKYSDTGGLLEQLDVLNDTFVETDTTLTDFNQSVITFSNALKSGSTTMDDFMNKLSSMNKSTATKNLGNEQNKLIKNFAIFSIAVVNATNRLNKLGAGGGTGGTTGGTGGAGGTATGTTGGTGGAGGTATGTAGARVASGGGGILKLLIDALFNIITGGLAQMNKLEEAFRPLNKQMGLSAESQMGFIQAMNKAAVNTTTKFGITAKDLGEIQSSLFSETGRIQVMTLQQTEKVAAMAKLVGNQSASRFVSDMDKIGASITTSAKSFESIRIIAGKAGVDMVKSTTLVQQNIQKAQSYAFKDGVNSLAQMATKSLQMRMNMEQIFKFSEANASVEGAVTQAAQMQVLGGAFSSLADPLRNLYNSLYDQNAHMDRLMGLGTDVMRFDRESGTMRYKSAQDELRAKAFAKNSGLDIGELQSGWTRTGIGKEIENRYGSRISLTGEDRETAKSRASWNKEMNAWTVSIRKLTETGEYEYRDTDITQLTKEDLKSLKPDESQNVDEIARTTMTIKDKLTALLEGSKTAFGAWAFRKLGPTLDNLMNMLEQGFSSLSSGMKAFIGAGVLGLSGMGNMILGGVKKLIGGQISGFFGLAKPSAYSGMSRGAAVMKAGKGVLKTGGPLAGLIAGGMEAWDQIQQGNFRKESGNQGKAIGSTAGAGLGGWGGAAAGAAIGTAILPGIGTAIGGIIGGIAGSSLGKSIGNSIGKYFDEGGGKKIKDNWNKTWGSISTGASKAWSSTKSFFGGVSDSAKSMWDTAKTKNQEWNDFQTRMGTKMVEGAKSMFNKGKDFLTENGVKIFNVFENVRSKITDFRDGIINSFKSILTWIKTNLNPVNWVKGGVDWIKDKIGGTSSTRSVNDMIKTPNGVIYTDPKDVIMAVKPGGNLSTFFTNGVSPKSFNSNTTGGSIKVEPITINISGSIRLEGANQTINMDALATNRQFVNTITQAVTEGINRNMNSGRSNNSGGLKYGNYQRGMF